MNIHDSRHSTILAKQGTLLLHIIVDAGSVADLRQEYLVSGCMAEESEALWISRDSKPFILAKDYFGNILVIDELERDAWAIVRLEVCHGSMAVQVLVIRHLCLFLDCA